MHPKGTRTKRRLLLVAATALAFATPAAAWRSGPFIVFFDYDRQALTPQAMAILDNLANELRIFPEAHIVVQGHTDRTGAAAANLVLSCRRARVAEAYLLAKGVAAARMTVQGYGEDDPLVDTDDGVREPQNRRVAFTFGTAAEIAAARSDPRRC